MLMMMGYGRWCGREESNVIFKNTIFIMTIVNAILLGSYPALENDHATAPSV